MTLLPNTLIICAILAIISGVTWISAPMGLIVGGFIALLVGLRIGLGVKDREPR